MIAMNNTPMIITKTKSKISGSWSESIKMFIPSNPQSEKQLVIVSFASQILSPHTTFTGIVTSSIVVVVVGEGPGPPPPIVVVVVVVALVVPVVEEDIVKEPHNDSKKDAIDSKPAEIVPPILSKFKKDPMVFKLLDIFIVRLS